MSETRDRTLLADDWVDASARPRRWATSPVDGRNGPQAWVL